MKTLRTTPILWALTGLLAACGNTSTVLPANNQSPEASIKLADGTALSTVSYLGPTEALTLGVSDADGSVTKVHWTIDQGSTSERNGDFTGSDVKGKISFTLPGLASGSHTLNLTVTDNQGATGTASATFKVDAVAPVLSGISVNGTAVSDGQALSFASTDAATLTVSATDQRGGNDLSTSTPLVLVYVGSTLVKTASAPLTLDLAALLSGSAAVNTVRVVAADSALNTSASRTFTVQFAAATTGTGTVDSTPVLSWLAPAGDYVRGNGTVTLRASAIKAGKDISSQVAYTTTCGSVSGGVWTLGTDCADGSKQTITANLTDSGKNYTISKTVTVDSADPTVQLTSPQQGQTVTANPVNVTFAATDSGSGIDHVEVAATDASGTRQMVGSVASASGTVVWAPQNGTYTLTATAYDKVGRSATTSLGNVKVQLTSSDSAAPSVNTFSLPGGVVRRTVTVSAAVSDPSPSSGIAKVELFEGSTSLGVQTAGVNGTYTFSLDTTKLSDGQHTLRAVVTDNVGLSAEKTGTLTTDNTAPVVNWQSPRDGQVVKGNVTLNATTSEGTVTYTVDGVAVTAGAQNLSDGQHTLTATATDAAGNSTSSSIAVTADSTAPSANILSPAEGAALTQNPVTVQVSGSDTLSGIDHLELREGATLLGTVAASTGNIAVAFGNGAHTLTLTAYDKAGNISTATRSFTITTSSSIKPGAPAITAANTTGTNPQYVRGLGAVAGTASSTVTITTAQLLVDGQPSGPASSNSGSASFNFDFSSLNEGLHDLGLRWQDSAGTLTDSAKLSVFVDKTAPVVVWNTPVAGSVTNKPVVLSATATDAASGLNGAVTYSVAGQAVTSPWTPAADGTYEVTASASDGVNNVGTQKTSVTYDATAPVVTATSPANAQVFTTAPVTITATATDNLSIVKSIEATIQGPNDTAPTTLGVQTGATYSTTYAPVVNGTYTVVYKALDAAGNSASTVTRTFSYSNSTTPVEGAPAPVISVVGSNPHSGNMTVTVNGNFDARSTVDRLVLQITDFNGVVDNTSYVTTQANGTFSVDTTKLANGDLKKLEAIAYTKSNLSTTKLYATPVTISNLNSPLFSVASPADGASLTTPVVPVKLTLTTRGTEYTYANTVTVDVLDSRGKVALTKVSTSTSPDTKTFTSPECSGDNASLTCNLQFDMAGLPADTYTVRARTNITIAATGEVRPLETTSRFTSNTTSLLPPAATVRFPAITNNRTVGRIDSSSGTLVNVSDDTGVSVVEARIVGPFDASTPLALNGTTQCQESVPVGNAVDVLLLNYGLNPIVKLGDVFLPSLDIDGSAYVPDNQDGQRYDLRVTTIDTDKNRNIQCIPVTVTRDKTKAERIAYVTSNSTTPATPDLTPGKLNYTAGSWTISNLQNDSRVAGVVYINGVQQSVSFTASTNTSANVSINFADEGTYQVVWLVEDMTTGIVTSKAGGYISVKRNPTQ